MLVVSDLYLGSPATADPGEPDECVARLLALVADYQPKKVALMGELAHPGADPAKLTVLLKTLLNTLREQAAIVLLGEPAPNLTSILRACDWHADLAPYWVCERDLLLQGNAGTDLAAEPRILETQSKKGMVIIGGESPCLALKGGATTYPCFLLSDDVAVLPSFSTDEDGNDIFDREPQSALARKTTFRFAVAIRDRKLVPTRLYPHFPTP